MIQPKLAMAERAEVELWQRLSLSFFLLLLLQKIMKRKWFWNYFANFFCQSIKRSIQELINLGQKCNKINYRELKYYIDTEMIVQSDNFFSETGSSDLATYIAWPSTILQKRNIIILWEISHENVRKTLDGAIKT